MTVRGGKPAGPLGILMLETAFPRVPGDIGNPATWPFPVDYRVVKGASPDQVVRRQAQGLLPAFVEAAKDLDIDQIVMGAHRPSLADFLLGPNSARVARMASISATISSRLNSSGSTPMRSKSSST